MRAMFAQIFSTIELIFATVHSFASAAKHIGDWTEAEAASFADQARVERQKKLTALQG